jgi:hypothetical protein
MDKRYCELSNALKYIYIFIHKNKCIFNNSTYMWKIQYFYSYNWNISRSVTLCNSFTASLWLKQTICDTKLTRIERTSSVHVPRSDVPLKTVLQNEAYFHPQWVLFQIYLWASLSCARLTKTFTAEMFESMEHRRNSSWCTKNLDSFKENKQALLIIYGRLQEE